METLFDVLGLPRRYDLDASEVERAYLERSKQHHPDRHAKADAATRARALLLTTDINEAYRTLKHPVRRAEYLLRVEGYDLGDEEPQKVGAPRPTTKLGPLDPALLAEVMEMREALDDARQANDGGRVATLAADVRAQAADVMSAVKTGFAAAERGDRERLKDVAAGLVKLRYLQRFLDEVAGYEEVADGAR